MNIAFFLLPKQDVVYLAIKSSLQKALEKMELHRFSAIPLIDEKGKYIGTITEGDLLWKMKNTPGLTFADTIKIRLGDVPRRTVNTAVRIDAEIEDLLTLAINQNFVPVIDDNDYFIGIVRRRDIIGHFVQSRKTI
jgi:CBS-domain-containing membrane protein